MARTNDQKRFDLLRWVILNADLEDEKRLDAMEALVVLRERAEGRPAPLVIREPYVVRDPWRPYWQNPIVWTDAKGTVSNRFHTVYCAGNNSTGIATEVGQRVIALDATEGK